jgi:hypothetical protein
MQLAPMYSPPRTQQRWAPARAVYRPDLSRRPVMGQLDKLLGLLGAGMTVQALNAGLGGAVAYLGFYHGVNGKGIHKWLGWIAGAVGGVYALSSLAILLKLSQVRQTVEKVSP